jgi:hypothetical protein
MKLFRLLILALVTSLSSATNVHVSFAVEVSCSGGCSFNNGDIYKLEQALADVVEDQGDLSDVVVNANRRSLEEVGAEEFVNFSDEAELGHGRRLQFESCFDIYGEGCNGCPDDDCDASGTLPDGTSCTRNLRALDEIESYLDSVQQHIESAMANNLEVQIEMHGAHQQSCNDGEAGVCTAAVNNMQGIGY